MSSSPYSQGGDIDNKKHNFAYTGLTAGRIQDFPCAISTGKRDFCPEIIDIAKGIMYNIEIVKISLFT